MTTNESTEIVTPEKIDAGLRELLDALNGMAHTILNHSIHNSALGNGIIIEECSVLAMEAPCISLKYEDSSGISRVMDLPISWEPVWGENIKNQLERVAFCVKEAGCNFDKVRGLDPNYRDETVYTNHTPNFIKDGIRLRISLSLDYADDTSDDYFVGSKSVVAHKSFETRIKDEADVFRITALLDRAIYTLERTRDNAKLSDSIGLPNKNGDSTMHHDGPTYYAAGVPLNTKPADESFKPKCAPSKTSTNDFTLDEFAEASKDIMERGREIIDDLTRQGYGFANEKDENDFMSIVDRMQHCITKNVENLCERHPSWPKEDYVIPVQRHHDSVVGVTNEIMSRVSDIINSNDFIRETRRPMNERFNAFHEKVAARKKELEDGGFFTSRIGSGSNRSIL